MTARGRRAIRYDRTIFLLALLTGLPGTLAALVLLWSADLSPRLQWGVGAALLIAWWGLGWVLRAKVVRPLQTLSNLLAALRGGDFSIRAHGARPDDSLGLALMEVNALSGTLRGQRLGALEATALLRTAMAEVDVAIFTFDAEDKLRLVNRAGERLLGESAPRLLGRGADELGLSLFLQVQSPGMLEAAFPGGAGRWEIRRTTFREAGLPHHLLVLTDLSRALREEERQAWQRLVRVLSHEINNSLAPIRSIAGSLSDSLRDEPPADDLKDDLQKGLEVIVGRSSALARFIASYARLARLPRPDLAPLDTERWVRRVTGLEMRLDVEVHPGPRSTILGDGDQLDQLLINLVRNAADASLETDGRVDVAWSIHDDHLDLFVDDEGLGIADPANLFVPFYTTKPHGNGIGLALSRQIAESHGGSLTLDNRTDRRGCRARLRLPLSVAASGERTDREVLPHHLPYPAAHDGGDHTGDADSAEGVRDPSHDHE